MTIREAIEGARSVWFPADNLTVKQDIAKHFEDRGFDLDAEVNDDVYTWDAAFFVVDGIGYR